MLLAILWGDLLWWGCVYCLIWRFHKSVTESMVILSKGCSGISVICRGQFELLLFLSNKVYIEQCISLYPCSCLSSSTAILLSNRSVLMLGFPVYHVLPLIMCTSMPWGSQGPRISFVSLWHVCKAVLLHVWRDQPHALVLFHLTVHLKCICKMGPSFASVGVLLIYLLTKIKG